MTVALFVFVKGVFFMVGPTATGKSEIAADVARELGAEIVSADAFQIYRGLDLLTAKPNAATLAKAPHHLIGTMSILEEMNAEKFRRRAMQAISEIHSRANPVIVVGGSGLYIKALTHGLTADWKKVDVDPKGVFVFPDREELYSRINRRVEMMFENGVIEEVRAAGAMSETASKMIGLREIRDLLEGKMSILQCAAQIQQATRQYAKRQLTWFRHQTNFEPLNLSLLSHGETVKWISQRARRAFAEQG
ncbi:MAG TPA: tRNA (adenosine(37)-N6)-dimethylallyltransferase MiaA [Chthoniobacterales bacterium]|nr:tRNA (adenosine(37)-N6)-dimethylallyltransferase MiaA [Chthoniobacterales bacterium]